MICVFLKVEFCVRCCDDEIRCVCVIVFEAELRNDFVLLVSELNWLAVANGSIKSMLKIFQFFLFQEHERIIF